MLYGDDPLKLNNYTYAPSLAAIIQSGNLYVYCGNNPILHIDSSGAAWYHWAIGGAIVAVSAVAVISTAGGVLPAMYAIGSVANGFAASSAASTMAAGAFIGTTTAYGSMALIAGFDSKTFEDFNQKGNWGTVFYTAGSAGLGGIAGYAAYRNSESHNIFTNKTFTNKTGTGVWNYESATKGFNAAKADFDMLNPYDVKTYSNGAIVGYLSDGRTVNIHPGTSVGKAPTLEIYDSISRESIKFRY